MTMIIDGTNGLTFPDSSQQYNSYYGFKNRIINGAMVIDQRNAGASVTPTNGAYTLDRWQATLSQTSKYSVQQSSTAPTGFTNSIIATSLSAYSVGASESFRIQQPIEGNNCGDLGWGAAGAQTVTLSFWVRSSLTGTFGGSISNAATDRSYVFSYTISAANTWEQKTVTIPGDTTGTWNKNTSAGIYVIFSLGAGSSVSTTAGSWVSGFFASATGATSVVGTNGATFYITGVQLEKGSTATSFDYRPYSTELQLAQRYYYRLGSGFSLVRVGSGYNTTTTTGYNAVYFPVEMRIAPTALEQSGTANHYSVAHAATTTACSVVPVFADATPRSAWSVFTVASGLTVGQGSSGYFSNTAAYLGWSAEL